MTIPAGPDKSLPRLSHLARVVRLLGPLGAAAILGSWIAWLYFSSDFGAVAIFVMIFASGCLLGGAIAGPIGSLIAWILRYKVGAQARAPVKARHLIYSLVFWASAGFYIGGCLGIVHSILIAVLLYVLSFFGLLFLPVAYTASVGAAVLLAVSAAAVLDYLAVPDPAVHAGQGLWSSRVYAGLSWLTAMPALASGLAISVGLGWLLLSMTILGG
jgi:hypothetical protein